MAGTSGQWRDLLDDADLTRYAARVRALASDDLVAWVHREAIDWSYFTSERRRDSSPMTRGSTIQMAVVEPSMAHSRAVSVPPSNSATCV
jgi:hypothetical protein